MAGRGVDILLGGNPEYLARQEMAARDFDNDAYLLFEMDDEERADYEAEYEPIFAEVQGADRHGARRGRRARRPLRPGHRAARVPPHRQPAPRPVRPPGRPRRVAFYLSLEDDLMRLFASDRIASIMERLKWPEDEPIEAKMVTPGHRDARRRTVEEQNFEIRKNVLKYDEVMNTQRKVIYGERQKILEGDDLRTRRSRWSPSGRATSSDQFVSQDIFPEEWDLDGLLTAPRTTIYPVTLTKDDLEELERPRRRSSGRVVEEALDAYEEKERTTLGGERSCASSSGWCCSRSSTTSGASTSTRWTTCRRGSASARYGQRDPLAEYQREAFAMFEEMKDAIRDEFVRYIYRVELVRQDEPPRPRPQRVVTEPRRRRRGARGRQAAEPGRERQDRPQRPLPVRLGQEVQEVPRR